MVGVFTKHELYEISVGENNNRLQKAEAEE